MSNYCCANFCKNSNKNSDENIVFHSFPKNKCQMEKWLKFCKRTNIKSGFICSEHFTEDDYEVLRIALHENDVPTRRLKKNSVPSIQIPLRNIVKEVTDRSKRKLKRERTVLVQEALLEYSGNKIQSNNIKYKKKFKYADVKGNHDEFEICLLNSIFERPPLFDYTLPNVQRSPDVIKKLWEEVSYELSEYGTFDNLQLISFWRRLRNSYTRYNRIQKTSSNSSAILIPNHVDILKQLDNVINKTSTSNTETWSDEWSETYKSDSEYFPKEVHEISFVSVDGEKVNGSNACDINTTSNSKSELNSNNKFRKKNKHSNIIGTEEEFEIALLNLIFDRPSLFDFTLPIMQKSDDVIDKLWEEVSDGLSKYGTFSKSQLMCLWRPLRDNYTRYKNSLKNVCFNPSAILALPKHADIFKKFDSVIDKRRLNVSTETDTTDICSSDNDFSIPKISKSSITIHSCRTCLNNDGTLSLLESHNNLLIVDMISDLTNVKVNVVEGFLKTICKSCVEKLYAAFVFKQECENSEKIMQHFVFEDLASKEETKHISETEFTETDSCIEYDHNTDNMNASISLQIELVDISEENKLSENYECDLCFHAFENEQSLATHRALVHKEGKQFNSEYGEKSAEQYTEIIEEEEIDLTGISEEKELQLQENMEFQCNICLKQFHNNKSLKSHMRRHETPKFICEICSKPFYNKYDLLQHQRLIHLKEKPHKCVICNRGFFLKSALKMHEFIHTGEKPFECKYCGKTFRHRTSKIIHTKLHTGDNKRHQCEICLRRFSFPSSLRVHKRKHTGEKPFQCQYCKLRFNQNSALTMHLRIHTGFKPFKCQICEKAFTLHAGLRRHVIIHTGEKPFKCMFCNNKYGNISNQRTHTNHYCKNNPNRIRKNMANT